jgi:hypothetical protein
MPNPASPEPTLCEIALGSRAVVCEKSKEHKAIVRVVPHPCGHSIAYCKKAAKFFMPNFKRHGCHVCDEYPKSYTVVDLRPEKAKRVRKVK